MRCGTTGAECDPWSQQRRYSVRASMGLPQMYVMLSNRPGSAQDEHVAGAHRPAQALDLQLTDRFDVNDFLDHAGCALAEQDLVGGCLAAER